MSFLYKSILPVFVLLGGTTFLSYYLIPQFTETGPTMLNENWDINVSEFDKATADKNRLNLHSSDHRSVYVWQKLKPVPDISYLKLSADIGCEDVEPGQNPWEKARFLMLQYNHSGSWLRLTHGVGSLQGTKKIKKYSKTFKIAEETREIKIQAELLESSGSLWVINPQLVPVIPSADFRKLKKIMIPAWGIFFILLFGSIMHGEKTLYIKTVFSLSFIFIIAATTITGEVKTGYLLEIGKHFQTTSQYFNSISFITISKIGHFCLFCLFGIGVSVLKKEGAIIHLLVYTALLAGGSEMIQFYIEGRSVLFSDVTIDIFGGLSGIMLVKILCSRSCPG